MLWGKPLDPQTAGNDVTLIERWHGTANAMENLAATHNGMVLCMDELGGNTDEAFSVYNQTSGRGKNRMTRDGGVQAQRKWSLLSVSTGEVSLTERLEAGTGKPAKTGEIIRGLSIPLDSLPAYEELSTEEASQRIQSVKTQLTQTYGTIGPAFVQHVLDLVGTASELKSQLLAQIDEQQARLVDLARDDGRVLEPPHIRALRRFALINVLGQWASDDYLPFSSDQIEAAVDRVTLTWLDSLPALNDEDRIVGQIRDWIIRHQRWILLTETEFAEACDGTSTMAAGKLLKRLGILDCEGGKHKKRHLLGGLNLPATFFYSILTAKLLPQTEQDESLAAGPVPTTGLGPRPVPPRTMTRHDDDDLEATPNF